MWSITKPNFVNELDLPKPFNVGEFSPAAVNSFSRYLENVYNSEVPIASLRITSDGGDVGSMNGFFSLMEEFRNRGIKFAGFVPAYALSAGAAVFLFCDSDYRWMGPSATLMIHNSQIAFPGDRISSVKNFSDFVHSQDEIMNQKLSLHLKKRKDWLDKELKKRHDNDWHITAQEAQTLGFAKIGFPEFNVRISAEFSVT